MVDGHEVEVLVKGSRQIVPTLSFGKGYKETLGSLIHGMFSFVQLILFMSLVYTVVDDSMFVWNSLGWAGQDAEGSQQPLTAFAKVAGPAV